MTQHYLMNRVDKYVGAHHAHHQDTERLDCNKNNRNAPGHDDDDVE